MSRKPYILFALLIFAASCSPSYYHYDVKGADEFVIDSYKIRQGKMSILEMEGTVYEKLPLGAMDEYVDQIHEDDILNIAIYHPTRKDLIASFKDINENIGFRVIKGEVKLPDIPSISVAGLTLDEAKDEIQRQFQEQIQDIEVFVKYKDRLSRKVELMGLVGIPNIPVDGKMRLFDTLSIAKVSSSANLFMSYIIRDNRLLPIDLHRLMKKGDMRQNIVMRGGDKIFIANPNDSKVMLMGEVGSSRTIDLPYGFVSLREALVSAGGIPFTGNKKNIQVIRGNLTKPKIYVHLSV